MDPIEKMERKREAQRRLRAQRRRVVRLRSRVVVISLISFVLLWGVIFAQMATGNDPVLGASSPAITKSAAAEAVETTAPEELEPEVIEPESVEEEPVEVAPEPEPAPVTTSQS
ncbi:MAG: hypothetical protein QOF85_419 [Solirubrobacterales bacterium]|jgi:cytoskeletal protein RodZ|nr:hypothetical protein [Solirubrobacterales bacterium]